MLEIQIVMVSQMLNVEQSCLIKKSFKLNNLLTSRRSMVHWRWLVMWGRVHYVLTDWCTLLVSGTFRSVRLKYCPTLILYNKKQRDRKLNKAPW